MPNTVRVEIEQIVRQNDPSRDYCENSLYFQTQASAVTADYQALSDAVSAIWKMQGLLPAWGWYSGRQHTVKVYDMADAKPRPVRAHTTYVPSFWANGDLLPRQVALCLSFYSTRNLPRQRSRIYLGPIDTAIASKERPGQSAIQSAADLGTKLYGIASTTTPSWVWGFRGLVPANFEVVTNWWVNDAFDTQRRRVARETTRVRLP